MAIEIDGLERILQKATPAVLFRPLRNFFERGTITIQGRARVNSPVKTGRLRASIDTKLDYSEIPLWGQVGSNVEYAKPVEYGTGAYSDAPDSKHGRGGMKPRRYLRNAFGDSLGDIKGFLVQLRDELVANWDKR